MDKQKVIALVDCDSFFVSCEQRANPELKNKPVCVLSNDEGCIISRSKEAKAMGVKMGMPYFMAKNEYPEAIYITANHTYYSQVSKLVMTVLKWFSPYVQIYSVDEAFVDFTGLKKYYKKNYYDLAVYLKNHILDETDIPVSIGVSSTKTLAKLASDKAKTFDSHVCLIGTRKIPKILKSTGIDEIWGIGSRLTKRIKSCGIIYADELVAKPDVWFDSNFGINGLSIKHELLGEMVSPVVNEVSNPKSIQNSRAFGIFTSDFNFIKNELNKHIHTSCAKLRRHNSKCSQIGIMLRTKDFKVSYLTKALVSPTDFELEISGIAIELLKNIYKNDVLYRAVGVVLDRIGEEGIEQLNLYSDSFSETKKEKLGKCFDKLESKFGKNIIQTGFTVKN